MVQEFHVVRCFSCDTFQVQQVKKANKWSCKVCGEKQSLLKEFGRGSAADCRRHVQKLNAMRGAVIEEQEHNTWSLCSEQVEEAEEERDDQVSQTQVSRWTKYLDTPKEVESEEENEEHVLIDRQQLHGSNMTDRKRKGTDTPEQLNCEKRKHVPVPATNRTTSLIWSSPHLTQSSVTDQSTGLTQSSVTDRSPRLTQSSGTDRSPHLTQSSGTDQSTGLTQFSPPILNPGPGSRWSRFLSSDHHEQEGVGPSVTKWTATVGGATKPRPLLSVSSLFETKEEFDFDDAEFLMGQRV